MNFDPAIAAQVAFKQALESGLLGPDAETAVAAENTFSASAGSEAKAAYMTLQELGRTHADAQSFQEFLIYITWQQVTEETIPLHFRRGLDLCNHYLARFGRPTETEDNGLRQVRALRESFHGGLGLTKEDDHGAEYDKDAIKGGD
ncbi:MAG: hypothetical protein EPO61_13900 [Nitrospirae bacterium]|nr:MAG: hypothetical protein EPO61_13900 [Nitrospirota bacterium]